MRSLNKVMLIGNATKDPELRYTPQGTAVCSFSVATNREWKNSTGEVKSEATFSRVIAWSKLGEIISQYVKRGSKVYLEGRLSNRQWKDQAGVDHYMTEIVADELILLDNKKVEQQATVAETHPVEPEPPEPEIEVTEPKGDAKEDVNPDDIPF
jgi:single-strand DNA-binding protein